MKPQAPEVRIGCSGWNYKSWRGRFYPATLPHRQWLDYYCSRFDTVEINNTFYRLPDRDVFAAWRAEAPADFRFAVKASRYLTHMKRLIDPENPVALLFDRASALGRKLGPVLYQLPGQFTRNVERLQAFLEVLPPRRRHAIEFRHQSWYVPEVFECLHRNRVALCLHDRLDSSIAEPFVGPFVYVRFHGPSGQYHGRYRQAALRTWADRLAARARSGVAVYAFFNNDVDAAAPGDAWELKRLMGLRVALRSRVGVQRGRSLARVRSATTP